MEQELIPGLLTAMPTLQDPYFEKTVILMCNYTEEGAFGIIVNTPSSTEVKDILTDEIEEKDQFDLPVLIGGPVHPESFWAVHTSDYEGETTTKISSNISLSSAQDVLIAMINNKGPQISHVGCGYSGWGSAQLDREIQEEAWWLGPLDESLVLEMPYSLRWESTLSSLGIDPLTASFIKTGTV